MGKNGQKKEVSKHKIYEYAFDELLHKDFKVYAALYMGALSAGYHVLYSEGWILEEGIYIY